jgi:hypothetical protein
MPSNEMNHHNKETFENSTALYNFLQISEMTKHPNAEYRHEISPQVLCTKCNSSNFGILVHALYMFV